MYMETLFRIFSQTPNTNRLFSIKYRVIVPCLKDRLSVVKKFALQIKADLLGTTFLALYCRAGGKCVYVRFQVLSATSMRTAVFWVFTPYNRSDDGGSKLL
jgi:hypothetical protein